jgi:hypothetical protein
MVAGENPACALFPANVHCAPRADARMAGIQYVTEATGEFPGWFLKTRIRPIKKPVKKILRG